ncbi:unnamed protein product [Prunus brigantina]
MFADAFNELQVLSHLLNRSITPLVSFSGEVVQPIGSIHLPISIGAAPLRVTVTTHFLIIDCPIAYKVILGSPAMAQMKVFISTHTAYGIGTVYDDQLAARSCYASAVRSTNRQHRGEALAVRIGTSLSQELRSDLVTFLCLNSEVFAWSYNDMPGISPDIISHHLSVNPVIRPVRQKRRAYDPERYKAMKAEVDRLSTIGFIKEPVDATAGYALLSFMDAYSRYNQIFMHHDDQAHTSFTGSALGLGEILGRVLSSFITNRGLYCYMVMPFGLKNAGATY